MLSGNSEPFIKEIRARDAAGPALKKRLTLKPRVLVGDDAGESANADAGTGDDAGEGEGAGNVAYNGALACDGGKEAFSVNETGRRLLEMADGSVSIDEMIAALGLEEHAKDVGMFFVTLGMRGYLENRVEIELYETGLPPPETSDMPAKASDKAIETGGSPKEPPEISR